ncbi:putative transcriptional regulator [Geomicrobium halophilum]|uniref:Putative transcriptional regulator n=1 Tax=Geomicrobium halophilum TaxID=549000 RepID=A0A841PL84_9BACL|nr:helix-turn-helix domain-containing protein [Geomicrobium halophilum]MBB6449617.1 putative transcriptional regulator [Geomicrobium halophilum]
MTKLSNLTNADAANYRHLSQFETIKQLNEAIRAHLYENSHALSKAAIAVFKALKNHAAKYVGVAFMKYDTLAAACDVSYSTVKRSIRALEKYGMLEVHRTKRTRGTKGGYGHNVFVITAPAPADLPSDPSKIDHRDQSTNTDTASVQGANSTAETALCEASTTKCSNKESNAGAREEQPVKQNEPAADIDDLDSTFAHVPEAFAKQCRPFFDAATTTKLYRRAQAAYRRTGGLDYEVGAYVNEITAALKRAIYTLKTGKLRGDLPGYFYTAAKNALNDCYNEEVAAMMPEEGSGVDLPAWLA